MKKIKKPNPTPPARIYGFHKRWLLERSDEARWLEFKNRFMNTFEDVVGSHFLNTKGRSKAEFYRLVGKHEQVKATSPLLMDWDADIELLGSCSVYQLMLATTNMYEFTLQVQALFWVGSLKVSQKRQLQQRLLEDIRSSGVPIEITGTGSSVVMYPAGARVLDEGVVNEVLTWLEPVDEAHDRFAQALSLLGKKGSARDVADNLRLSLELTMRHVLGNTKSLENQQSELGFFLKQKGVGVEVSNMYWKLVDLYSKFQNDRAKHGNKVQEQEVEFILYLTGTFIRFLVTLK